MSVTRQICRVIESDASSRKITVELNGNLIKTEKILGLDFRIGDFACLQSYVGSNKSLVVPLNSDEVYDLKNKKEATSKKNLAGEYIPLGRIIPADEDIKVENYLGLDLVSISKKLSNDLAEDPFILERLQTIFDMNAPVEKLDSSLRDVFPLVAVQTNEEFQELKKNVYKKADEMLCRKLIYEQSNREVHEYLMDKIDNITSENEHTDFFKSLGYYLERLRNIQAEKGFSSSKMGVVFYPIYSHYVKRFNSYQIEKWIQLKSNNSLV